MLSKTAGESDMHFNIDYKMGDGAAGRRRLAEDFRSQSWRMCYVGPLITVLHSNQVFLKISKLFSRLIVHVRVFLFVSAHACKRIRLIGSVCVDIFYCQLSPRNGKII